jgi:hypothetical protein
VVVFVSSWRVKQVKIFVILFENCICWFFKTRRYNVLFFLVVQMCSLAYLTAVLNCMSNWKWLNGKLGIV